MENRLTGVQESIDDTRESLDDGKIVEVLRALQAAQGWALNRFTFRWSPNPYNARQAAITARPYPSHARGAESRACVLL